MWGAKAKKPLDARRQVHTALVMVYLSSLPISSSHVLWPGETVTLPGFWGLCCAGQYLENHRSGHLPFVCMPRELQLAPSPSVSTASIPFEGVNFETEASLPVRQEGGCPGSHSLCCKAKTLHYCTPLSLPSITTVTRGK